MISENDRDALIAYRLEQAKETIDLSRFLIDSDKLVVAVNRIYYGLYYAVTALALKSHYETSKHTQLIGWFNKEFVSTEQIDKKFGKILRNAYQNRTKGDYDAFIKFDKEAVEDMHMEILEFIDQVGLMLKR
jgi:uncharacterized protein (UPF0332 family)